MDRRDFLKFLGMASSATVLSSCGVEKSTEKILPYLVPPDDPDYLPGEAMYRHSSCTECPAGCGTTVKIVDFNPVKLEGNAAHPLNHGAMCLRGQSSLMRLYHWDRYKSPMVRNGGELQPISWDEAYQRIQQALQEAGAAGRKNVYLSSMTGGSVSAAVDEFCTSTGVQRLPEYEVYAHANLRSAYRQLFGRDEIPSFEIENADFLVTIGADILETFVSPVSHASQLEKARRNHSFKWLHIEPNVSLTGFKAGERRVIKPGGEAALLAFILHFIDSNNLSKRAIPTSLKPVFAGMTVDAAAAATGFSTEYIYQMAQHLAEARSPLLIAGGVATTQANGEYVALLSGLLQYAMDMTGTTVNFQNSQDYSSVGTCLDIASLADELSSGDIGVVFVSRADVLATAPAGTGIAEHFGKASLRVALADLPSTTTDACDLILPLSHSLETWGDVQVHQGLTNFTQPVVEKMYDTRAEGHILREMGGDAADHEGWLSGRWQAAFAKSREALAEAGFASSAGPSRSVSLNAEAARTALNAATKDAPAGGATLFAVPSIRSYDGRSAALPLSAEVPDPLSTVSYGSFISVPQENAADMGLPGIDNVDKMRAEITISGDSQQQTVPHTVQPGLARDIYQMHREQIDTALLGYDARTGEIQSRIDGITVALSGSSKPLAVMAGFLSEGRRSIVTDEHAHHIDWLKGDETLYPDHEHPEYRWSISVDMESCTGCSACVAACHIENNVPCVGESENLKGREMSWIRIQPYYHEDGSMDSLVMLCQQCDHAPCENVCPVYATYHNEEGLNVMVYNRCVGTRYCHNNCPYKVRRFNWFDWADEGFWSGPMTRMRNPDVWIRPKGVMEKCTFCIQRIRKAKDVAKDEDRQVRDGEIVPACAQTCPTNAITFGNLLDRNSEVYKKSESDRAFRVLEVLGARPAVHYLRKEESA